jgi:hypothetical protein
VLRGRGALHAELARANGLDELAAHLRDLLVQGEPPIHLEAVVDESRAHHEAEALERVGGLSRAVLSLAEKARQDPSVLEKLLADEALSRLLAALRRARVHLEDDSDRLLARAAARALGLLVDESG